MLITNFSDNSFTSSGELVKDKQKIERLQRENRRLIEEAALKHQEERRHRQENERNDPLELHKDDHDHPEEERLKAQEQEKAQAGPIQIHAPIDNNPNAPGKQFFSSLYYILKLFIRLFDLKANWANQSR